VHIVTVRRLEEAAEAHREAARAIGAWIRIVKPARWRNFSDLRRTFPDADSVDGLVVFNIRHNRFRLIAAVHYAKRMGERLTVGHVYIGKFMTHKEYDRWRGLTRKEKTEWLQF
jgi:mRNA interferase HigB